MIREYGSEFQLDEEIVASCARKARFEFTSGQVRFFRAGRDALRYLAARKRDNWGDRSTTRPLLRFYERAVCAGGLQGCFLWRRRRPQN